MAISDTRVGDEIKVDFRYFISLALEKKISWRSLPSILEDFIPTLEKSKEVIGVLLKELQKLQSLLVHKEFVKIEDSDDLEIIEIKGNWSKNISISNFEKVVEDVSDDGPKGKLNNGPNVNGHVMQFSPDRVNLKEISPKINDSEEDESNRNYEISTFLDDGTETQNSEQGIQDEAFAVHSEFQENETESSYTENKGREDRFEENLITVFKSTDKAKCNICGKTLPFDNMGRHLKVHSSDKPFKCQLCMKDFKHHTSLKNHEKYHVGRKPLQVNCTFCDKKFKRSGNLVLHERLKHNWEFQNIDKLYTFVGDNTEKSDEKVLNVEEEKQEKEDISKVEPKEEKVFQCKTCHQTSTGMKSITV